LPLGDDQAPEQPRRAAGAYVQLCSAEVHACGLRKDGEIECWGSNGNGQLGLGDNQDRPLPTPLAAGVSFVSLACGGKASCAVADTGKLYCWGDNSEGLAAQADPYDSPDVLLPKLAVLEVAVRQVSVGQGHACAVAINGALYCWGRNTDSQLGIGPSPIQLRKPTPSDVNARYHQVAAGQQHSCGVRNDGTVYCWGRELAGRLGQGAEQDGKLLLPGQAGTDSDFVSTAVHWFHSCARRLNGKLVCWGRNQEGQLGVGDEKQRDTPAPVSGPSAWSAFAVGRFHTCGISQGQIYCWGMNDTGALGLPDDARQNMPVRVPLEEQR
jgi:alpha-tubulin suppressor-like RCC1 family protein